MNSGDGMTNLKCNEVMFIPQKPYNFVGTLRDQIMYPSIEYINPFISDYNPTDPKSGSNSNPVPYKDIDGVIHNITSNEVNSDIFYDILRSVRLGELAVRMGRGNETAGLTGTRPLRD